MTSEIHEPVLLQEAIAGLAIKQQGIYIDATFGRGGHSLAILKKLGPEGRLFAFDKDPSAVQLAMTESFRDPRFCIVHDSFSAAKKIMQDRGYLGSVDGILADLGVSSPQVDNAQRGFSFSKEGPLDMRMNPQQGLSAADWLKGASEQEIARVLRVYGEERYAGRIARAIVKERLTKPLSTTTELSDLIERVSPSREKHKHPATRSFQAIRIFINQELTDLSDFLAQSLDLLTVGGRLCVISFHSLEDRLVKRYIQKELKAEEFPPDLPIFASQIKPRLRKIGGLIRPQPDEVARNARARSARLRIAEKLR